MSFTTLIHDRAAAAPDAPALRDDAVDLTNAELLRVVEVAAGVLRARGVRAGDVVGVLLPNRADLIVALFAAWRIGAVVTPVNPALGDAEARFQLQDAGAVLVITDAVMRDLGVAALHHDDLLSGLPDAVGADRRPDDLALLIYTSGTTGNPKGVMLTHANVEAMTASFIEWFELTDADHSLLVLPLFHANGIVLGTLSVLRAGGQVSIVGRFSRDTFFDHVERLRPTYFSAVPAIYAMLSGLPDDLTPDTSSLRFAVCGAAPMPAEAIARFEQRFGVTIVEGYGLSETTTAVTINPLHGVRKPGTVGVALPGQRVAVVDEHGDPVPQGQSGEIVAAGPVVMAGYLGRPDATAEAIVDGWLHTGDVGVFDEDGYLRIVDRIKDMIIRGGENIYPKEIENALYAHPDVREAAVVGAPDAVLGEIPVAFVALSHGSAATIEDLTAACAVLAPFKRPVAITVVDEVPKNPVGKIDKPALRRSLANA